MHMDLFFLALVAIVTVAIGSLYRFRRARSLPDISDEEFLERYSLQYPSENRDIARVRRRIASILNIPYLKLAPDQQLDELSRRFEFLCEFSVGWSDLEDEVRELRRERGADEDAGQPVTVGELVAELATEL